jgi:hypothetical protein
MLDHRDPPSPSPPPREGNRWRRYRARRAVGIHMALTPYDAETVEFLVATLWLNPKHVDNDVEIGEAYYAMVKDAARRRFG